MRSAPALLALAALLPLAGCQRSPCPEGARTEKEGGFCVVLPSAYKKATDNTQEGRMVYAYGPTGKMNMFITPLSPEDYATGKAAITARLAVKPENPELIEAGVNETSAFQIFRWQKQTSVSAEYLVKTEKRAFKCAANTAKEDEARAVLSACHTLRGLN